MKKLIQIIGLFFFAFGTLANAQNGPAPAGDWNVSDNWLLTYKQNMGAGVSASWITAQVGDGAEMWESASTNGFVLVQEVELDDSPEAFLSEGEIAGFGTRFMQEGDVELHDGVYSVEMSGTLAGREVRLERHIVIDAESGAVWMTTAVLPSQNTNSLEVFEAGYMIAMQQSGDMDAVLAAKN